MHIPPNFKAQFDERIRPLDLGEVDHWNRFVDKLEKQEMEKPQPAFSPTKPAPKPSRLAQRIAAATAFFGLLIIGYFLGATAQGAFGTTVATFVGIAAGAAFVAMFAAFTVIADYGDAN